MSKSISFKKLKTQLQKGNYHLSKTKLDKFEIIKQKPRSMKPNGLWYSTNKWIIHDIHSDKEDNVDICCYIYKVIVKNTFFTTNLNDTSKSKLLQIKTIKQLDAFIKKYEYKNPKAYFNINWKLVAKDFKGIEFKPFIDSFKLQKAKKIVSMTHYFIKKKISEKQLDEDWDYYYDIYNKEYYSKFIEKYGFYDTIDIESGCIWDVSVIDNYDLLYKKNNKKWFIN